MTSWPDVPYQPEPAGPGSLAGTRTEGAGQPAQSTADGAHLEVRIPSLGDSKVSTYSYLGGVELPAILYVQLAQACSASMVNAVLLQGVPG